MLHQILGTILLISVLLLIIFRPKNLNVAWPTGIGALIAMLFGLLPLTELKVIVGDTWDASVTLIALFILSDALESNKFFDWAAAHLALKAKKSGWLLYIFILILTTITTALLANDGAILILTPIIATMLIKIYPKNKEIHLPFIFAIGFFADAMSIVFMPSNLTNIIIADANHLNFLAFAIRMAIPTIFAFLAAGLALGIRFRKEINTPYTNQHIENPNTIIKDKLTFWIGWGALILMIAGYIVGGEFHLPVALISLPTSLIMMVVVHLRKLRTIKEIFKEAPWNILVYALGMFVIITACYKVGIFNFFLGSIKELMISSKISDTFTVGAIFGGLSAIFNNLPATLLGVLSLRGENHLSQFSIYSLILGVNIGPKLTPFGSLSTLLWLSILTKNKIHISWPHYIKETWWVTVITFTAAFLGLFMSKIIFHF